NYRSNINDDISLHSKQNKTKQITLYDNTAPYTLELFQIIQKSFPRATKLIFVIAPIPSVSDNLLSNELIMENIVFVVFLLNQLKFKYFKRLLLMTPNILVLYIRHSVVSDILKKLNDSFQPLKSICNRIRRVHLDPRSFEYRGLCDNRIQVLFPNAELLGWN
ncbi:unnamed protein product, partial [Didymodactylos carnosus]